MSELWHGRLVHGPIEGCSDGCGARYAPADLPPIHSRGCPNRPPGNTGAVDEMYWWPRKKEKR